MDVSVTEKQNVDRVRLTPLIVNKTRVLVTVLMAKIRRLSLPPGLSFISDIDHGSFISRLGNLTFSDPRPMTHYKVS